MMFTQSLVPGLAPVRAPQRAPVRANATVETTTRAANALAWPERAAARAPERADAVSEKPAEAPVALVQAEQAAVTQRDKTIVIDAGHGGSDPGAVHKAANGETDVTEEDSTLAVTLKLAEMLRADGYEVKLTRSEDADMVPGGSQRADLQARVDIANEAQADVFVSVHFNGLDNKQTRGTEVWYSGSREYAADNEKLANAVQDALVNNLREAGYDTEDRGIKDDAKMGGFALLATHMDRPSTMPAIIGEALFMTNDQDAEQLKRPEVQEAIARGYFQGIKAYFGDK